MKKLKVFTSTFIAITFLIIANTTYAKYVIEKQIVVAKLNIDRSKPVGIVSYSPDSISNNKGLVTINLNEPIEEVEGWSLSDNKLILTKSYTNELKENIKIVDLSGNESFVKINTENNKKEKLELIIKK